MTALALIGWAAALVVVAWALALRRRLELVARAEHEIRGPMTALSLAREQLRHGRVPHQEVVGLFESQLDRALSGLADLSAARSGRRADLDPARMGLERLVRDAAAGWQPVAESIGRSVAVDWQAGPVAVRANRGRVSQAVGNLVSNAIEHGGGVVTLRARRRGTGVRLEVSDEGREPRTGDRQRAPGRGRGLSITAQAVEEAGGSLSLGRRGNGSSIAIELPVDRP